MHQSDVYAFFFNSEILAKPTRWEKIQVPLTLWHMYISTALKPQSPLVPQTLSDILTRYVGLCWIFAHGFEIINHLQQLTFTFTQPPRLMSVYFMHCFCLIYSIVIFNTINWWWFKQRPKSQLLFMKKGGTRNYKSLTYFRTWGFHEIGFLKSNRHIFWAAKLC